MVFVAGQKVRASELNALDRGELAYLAGLVSGDAMSLTTTEAVKKTITLNLVSGYTYRMTLSGVANASTAGANGFIRLRVATGGSASASDALLDGGTIAPNLSRGGALDNTSFIVRGRYTASTTGQHTFSVTGKSSTGTVTIPSDTANHAWLLTLDLVKTS